MNRTQRLGFLAVSAVGLSALGALPASAFVPTDQSHLEIPIPTYPTGVYETSQTLQSAQTVSASIGETYGGQWQVHSWNPQTNTPHRIFGSGADVAAGLAVDFDAAEAALAVATQNANILGVDPNALELVTVNRGLGKVAAHFQQTWNGYEVLGGRYHATFMETGRLFVMGSDFYSNIDLDPVPAISQAEAEAIATRDVNFDPSTDSLQGETELVVLPLGIAIDQVRHHLAYKMRVEVAEPYAIWETYVDAHAGEILWRFNDVHHFSGTTEGVVQQDTYCNGETPSMLGYMEVSVSGEGTTTSDANGNWSIGASSGSATVTSRFYGPWVDVNRASGGDAQFSGTADGGTPFTVDWNDSNSRQDERDVFEGVSDVRDFIASFDPGFGYINQRITANVGVNGTCNAFWNGTINFYNAGGGCANTGEIQGVVHHEFGHGVQASILGSQGNEGLGEGNSDILANFITDEAIIGRGFFAGNCTDGIRTADNDLQYPSDLGGGVHSDGRIMAGAVWDVSENLQATLGSAAGELRAAELWHFGRVLERPFNQPDQVLSMFVADDDDGNLINGTPNFDDICDGVALHNFECPLVVIGVFITHTPPASPHPVGSVSLVADVETTVGGANIDPSTVVIDYSINGGAPAQVVMTNDGGGSYSASLSIAADQELAYQISAQDDQGNAGTSPIDAPANLHYVDVPTEFDDIESNSGWSVNSEGSDDASTGEWTRVNPIGTDAQPEDDHTPTPGVNAWVTGQGTNGGALGENDVDGGSTSLYSPVYDASGADFAVVKYWRWYSNDKGNAPFADEWVVQARNDGGAWVDVERNQADQNQWFQVRADLVALFGTPGNVEFKFIASDLSDGSIVEAAVDDFSLVLGSSDDPADAPELGGEIARYALFGARPNPIAGSGSIAFQVPTRTNVSVGIYDVSGRSIRSLAKGSFEAGTHSLEWDGKDDRGHNMGSGVYYVQMVTGEYTATRKIALQK